MFTFIFSSEQSYSVPYSLISILIFDECDEIFLISRPLKKVNNVFIFFKMLNILIYTFFLFFLEFIKTKIIFTSDFCFLDLRIYIFLIEKLNYVGL